MGSESRKICKHFLKKLGKKSAYINRKFNEVFYWTLLKGTIIIKSSIGIGRVGRGASNASISEVFSYSTLIFPQNARPARVPWKCDAWGFKGGSRIEPDERGWNFNYSLKLSNSHAFELEIELCCIFLKRKLVRWIIREVVSQSEKLLLDLHVFPIGKQTKKIDPTYQDLGSLNLNKQIIIEHSQYIINEKDFLKKE